MTLAVAGIGVAGIVAGSAIQSARDDRRWERERQRERERWDREDTNRWFALKTERYAAFLKVANEWGNALLYPRLHSPTPDDAPTLEQLVDQEMSNLMFFASAEIREEAIALWEILQTATEALTETDTSRSERERIDRLVADWELWRQPFRDAAPDDDLRTVVRRHFDERWGSCATAMRQDLNVPWRSTPIVT
ncbi:hypothetical protein GCM10011576_33480 [Micromonospora parathelypteridis]|nr:hypothetical protein GCM10011576_33480 [Micromonospora parathelypteridis]